MGKVKEQMMRDEELRQQHIAECKDVERMMAVDAVKMAVDELGLNTVIYIAVEYADEKRLKYGKDDV